jgi:hypothetical protein
MTPEEQLARDLRGANMVIEAQSVSHLPSHNCLLVNDLFLLSYRDAQNILNRSNAARTIAGYVQGKFETFVGWLLQLIYRCCFKTQTPVTTTSLKETPYGETPAPKA